jgi:hypothetical protein
VFGKPGDELIGHASDSQHQPLMAPTNMYHWPLTACQGMVRNGLLIGMFSGRLFRCPRLRSRCTASSCRRGTSVWTTGCLEWPEGLSKGGGLIAQSALTLHLPQ